MKNSFLWLDKIYISSNLHMPINAIKKMVDFGLYPRPIYLVVLSENDGEQFEIISTLLLKLPITKPKEYKVVGVGKGLYHTRKIVVDIYNDILPQLDEYNAREYFERQFEQMREK